MSHSQSQEFLKEKFFSMLTTDELVRQAWRQHPEVRSEFGTIEVFQSYIANLHRTNSIRFHGRVSASSRENAPQAIAQLQREVG